MVGCVYIFLLAVLVAANEQSRPEKWKNAGVILNASQYWHNYRHGSNSLIFYNAMKKFGIADSDLVLFSPCQALCDPRNMFPGKQFSNRLTEDKVYNKDVRIAYHLNDVEPDSFLRVLTGKHFEYTPSSKRLDLDAETNVFLYMTGHSGEDFLKVKNLHDIFDMDLADAVQQMHLLGRYRSMLILNETCYATTLVDDIYSPAVLLITSSLEEEASFSRNSDGALGVSLIDRYTESAGLMFEKMNHRSNITVTQFQNSFNFAEVMSTPTTLSDNFNKSPDDTILMDYLGHRFGMKKVQAYRNINFSTGQVDIGEKVSPVNLLVYENEDMVAKNHTFYYSYFSHLSRLNSTVEEDIHTDTKGSSSSVLSETVPFGLVVLNIMAFLTHMSGCPS